MKSHVVVLTAMIFFGLTLTSVSASTSTSSSTIRMKVEESRQQLQERRQEVKTEIKTNRQEFKEQVKERVQEIQTEIAKRHAERLGKRFAVYNERLTNIATRIQQRIDTEKAEGKDVTSAQSSLDSAKTTLATAVSDGQKAVAAFTALPSGKWDTTKTEIKAAIALANTARKGFANAHKLMMDAVKALKTN